ncbi:MAG: Gfo/Idh/MocA family oxidoreductase [Clostridiales Family XIII bacterium]|jgi:predicted dehydrogenase|nr:Gfo/Idh/MocA family oxidoreductase [Clostridiales Family XIII bacterium]
MAKEIKYGMVGGSLEAFIGEVHRKAIGFDTRVELVCGCFSSREEKNRLTAEAYGIAPERTYADYKAMAAAEAARPDGIDFVSVTTPNNTHYDICKAFLEAGIHVVCDKPLCFEVSEAEELVKLAEEKDLVFGVTYTYTGYTMVKVAREMILSGKLGEIVAVNAEYVQDWLLDELSAENRGKQKNDAVWRTDPAKSGISNSVGDIGTHMENMISYLTGLKIKRLLSTVNTYGRALDLNSNIIVEYENGVNGGYWCSQVAAGKLNGLIARVYGTEGAIEWEQHYPDYLKYTPKGGAVQILSRGTGYITEAAGAASRLPGGHPEGMYVAFANIYRNVVSTIIKKKAGLAPDPADLDFPSVREGLEGVKFVHAVISSAKADSSWIDM